MTCSRDTAVAKLMNACSTKWWYLDSNGKARIRSVLNKFRCLGFLMEDNPIFQICEEQDSNYIGSWW